MKRRKFIRSSSLLGLGFLGLQYYAEGYDATSHAVMDTYRSKGYGSLRKDPEGVINLPEEFSYKIISRLGDKMTDGLLVPGLSDGMGTFALPNPDKCVIIRNHEISPKDVKNGAFGPRMHLLDKVPKSAFYDYGYGSHPCLAGTTSVIYNLKEQRIEKQWLSLAGTIRNCAGGVTPWGSWITCEETILKAGDIAEKDHGYNFEVPVTTSPKVHDPIPLVDMGRFHHEAVCVDPKTGIVYQTEDRPDGLFYRFIPAQPGVLQKGGKLQVLAILGATSFDTRNWLSTGAKFMRRQKTFEVHWLDISDVTSPDDDLRYRGRDLGAAVFARGEGTWFGEDELYFTCTNGGLKGLGQIFRYTPSPYEGTAREKESPGTIELFLEPNSAALVQSCDNMTIGPNGDLVICEDNPHPRILGVTPKGKVYKIGANIGFKSEFAGATFAPDGSTLFVNIQEPGITLAITGPWHSRES